MPNEIFALGLSSQEIAVYAYLLYCEDRKTYTCYPSYKTIGQALKLSKNTVKKYVDSLREKCLVETEPTLVMTKKGLKLNGNLRYKILPITMAMEHYYKEQMKRLNI